jgi:hypothetical protein
MQLARARRRLVLAAFAIGLVAVPFAGASTEPPPAPTDLVAVAVSFQRIDLSWGGSWQEEGYEIQQSTDGATWQSLGRSALPLRDAQIWYLNGETTYYFRVRAFNAAGDSPFSASASARTLTIPPGSLSAVAVSRSEIDLTWEDNSGEEVRFEIERSLDAQTFKRIATVGANVTAYADTPVRKGTTYHYRVRACTEPACTPFHYPVAATTPNR